MGVLLKGGRIITDKDVYVGDIRIKDETIVEMGEDLESFQDEVIDVRGMLVLPGGIDTHTHFDLDVGVTVTADDFSSGTKAAIIGGTTTILDYGCQNRGESLINALDRQFTLAKDKSYCDYGFHMGITDWNERVSEEMESLVHKGVTSYKLYMAYKGKLQVDDGVIYKVLKRVNDLKCLVGFHCENGDIIAALIEEARQKGQIAPKYHAITRPDIAEKEAISRVLDIAKLVGTRVLIVHLSTKLGLDIINQARHSQEVLVETCPQYLLLDDKLYGNDTDFEGAKFVMSPPLRKKEDNLALWDALSKGKIDFVGTDHCSFNYRGQKAIGIHDFSKIPNGAGGVEHRMALMFTYGVLENRITLKEWVEYTSTNAAKAFGLFPRKGIISVGSDADIIVWDPLFTGTISALYQKQNVDYTPYEGYRINGRVKYGFLRGNLVVNNGEMTEKKPMGIYLNRNTY